MTANKKLMVFIFGLCPIIPAASNFAYGLVLTVCLWIIFCLGFLGTYIFKLLEITHFNKTSFFKYPRFHKIHTY